MIRLASIPFSEWTTELTEIPSRKYTTITTTGPLELPSRQLLAYLYATLEAPTTTLSLKSLPKRPKSHIQPVSI